MYDAGVPSYGVDNPSGGALSFVMAMRILQMVHMDNLCQACFDRSKLRDLTMMVASRPMKYAVIDYGPLSDNSGGKGWTIINLEETFPGGMSVSHPEFEFSVLQKTVTELK